MTARKKWRVGAELVRGWVRVTISGVTHLRFKHRDLVAIQTWTLNGDWWLELTLVGGVIAAEYDTRAQLEDMLAAIEGFL